MSRESDRPDVWGRGQQFDHPEVKPGANDTSGRLCIVIADDDAQIRRLLKMLIEAKTDSFVVGEARDGAEAIEAVDRLRPDIVILDLEMPVMGGIERRWGSTKPIPDVHLMAFTSSVLVDRMDQLRQAGFADVVEKLRADELIGTVNRLAAVRASG